MSFNRYSDNNNSSNSNNNKRPSSHRRSRSPYRISHIPPPPNPISVFSQHLPLPPPPPSSPSASTSASASASAPAFTPHLETRIFLLESQLAAKTEQDSNRFLAIEQQLQTLQQRIDLQDQRVQSLEQRIESIGQHSLKGVQQLLVQADASEARAAATANDLVQLQQHVCSNTNNVAANMSEMIKVSHVLFVISEHSRKIDEKLRACEHQRIKAEAVLRSLNPGALTLQSYNALVEAGLQNIPELQHRIGTNKKDLLIGMAPRMKQDYKIDVIDENTGQIRTSLFPRQSHASSERSANQRAAALAAKAEANEVMFLRESQRPPM